MKNLIFVLVFVELAIFSRTTFGEFSRPSVAFSSSEESNTMEEYDVNEPCYRTMAVCSVSDGIYLTGEGPAGEDIAVHTKNTEYFFGIKSVAGRLLRSQDGLANWEYTNWNQVLNGGMVWALQSGTILISDRIDNSGLYRSTLYRSTDNGNTVDIVLTMGGDGFSSDEAFLRHWSVYQAPHGTILIAEYGQPALLHSGRRIFRSDDDGQTFVKVWDALEEGENYTHHHNPCYHSGLDRWVIVAGDGKRYRRLLANDNDGLADFWYNLTEQHHTYIQPTALLDYGHPTRLLFGSDTKNQVAWVEVGDVNTGQFRNVFTNWDPRDNRNLCFWLFEHDGVYYACNNLIGTHDQRNAVISVSTDLVHWAIYHRFTNNEVGVYKFAGYSGGKLHLNVAQANEEDLHFVISPAQVSTQKAVVVEPGTMNIFDDINKSSLESDLNGWWFHYLWTTHEVTTEEKLHGTASLHLVGSFPADMGNISLCSPKVAVETGKTYQGKFWIKGRNTRVEGRYSPTSHLPVAEPAFTLVDDTWQELILEPYTIGPNEDTNLGLNIYIGDWDAAQNSEELEVYIDCLQIEQVPGTNWQVGGTARADTKFNSTKTLPAEWTNIFTFYPSGRKEYYDGLASGRKLYIKSWHAGDAYAELYFDPTASGPNDDDEFVLFVTNGKKSYSVRTEPQHFQRLAQVKFAIVCYQDANDGNKTKLKMHVANGGAVETPSFSTSKSFDALSLGNVTTCIGNKDGLNVFAGLISHDDFLTDAVEDENIKRLLDAAGTGFLAADLNGDLRINFQDSATFASHWLDTVCASPALCSDADFDWSGRVDHIDLGTFVNHWLAREQFEP